MNKNIKLNNYKNKVKKIYSFEKDFFHYKNNNLNKKSTKNKDSPFIKSYNLKEKLNFDNNDNTNSFKFLKTQNIKNIRNNIYKTQNTNDLIQNEITDIKNKLFAMNHTLKTWVEVNQEMNIDISKIKERENIMNEKLENLINEYEIDKKKINELEKEKKFWKKKKSNVKNKKDNEKIYIEEYSLNNKKKIYIKKS